MVDTSRIIVNRIDRLEANIMKFVWMRGDEGVDSWGFFTYPRL